MPDAIRIDIANLRDMSIKLCLQFIIGASETKSHVLGTAKEQGSSLFDARSYFRKYLTAINKRRPTPFIIFLPPNYRAPSCQCARLFHELTSTRKRRFNLRATISWPAKRHACSIAIFDRAYMSPCVCTCTRKSASATHEFQIYKSNNKQ